MRPVTPEPALWSRRLQRFWRRRSVRRAVTTQIPALALAGIAAALASDPATHAAIAARAAALRAALAEQEAFAIRRIEIEGASPAVRGEIMAGLTDAMGASSLALDAAAVRRRVESLGWVESARVSLEAPEALRVVVRERTAAAVWRIAGDPWLVDAAGARIEPAFSRADRPDLPLVIGPGADRAVPEALAVFAAAGSLGPRIRGLVRVGERRWDAALDRDQRVLLPAAGAAEAMERAAALNDRHALFERDVVALDLRLPERPTVRLTERGRAALSAPPETAGEAKPREPRA